MVSVLRKCPLDPSLTSCWHLDSAVADADCPSSCIDMHTHVLSACSLLCVTWSKICIISLLWSILWLFRIKKETGLFVDTLREAWKCNMRKLKSGFQIISHSWWTYELFCVLLWLLEDCQVSCGVFILLRNMCIVFVCFTTEFKLELHRMLKLTYVIWKGKGGDLETAT